MLRQLVVLCCLALVTACGSQPQIAVTAIPVVATTVSVSTTARSSTTTVPPPELTLVPLTPTFIGPTPTTVLGYAKQIRARKQVPVLCYHHIRDWTAYDTPADKPYIMPVKRFREQIDWLARNGYHTINPDALVAYLAKGTPLPSKPVLLTFDDNSSTQWTHALPALRKHGFTATFFIMTISLDRPNYLSSDQVKQLDTLGMVIGAHSWDHHRADRYTGDAWRKQLTAPTAQLATLVGHPIRYWAYPFGLWDTPAITHVKDAGFLGAFQLNAPMDPVDPLHTIRRVIANSYWTLPQFERALINF